MFPIQVLIKMDTGTICLGLIFDQRALDEGCYKLFPRRSEDDKLCLTCIKADFVGFEPANKDPRAADEPLTGPPFSTRRNVLNTNLAVK